MQSTVEVGRCPGMDAIQFAMAGITQATLVAIAALGTALALRAHGLLPTRALLIGAAITALSWWVTSQVWPQDPQRWVATPSEGGGAAILRGWPAPFLYPAYGEASPSFHVTGLIADLALWSIAIALMMRAWRRHGAAAGR